MTDKSEEHIRIVDVARMAGVSVATVDRVIHNRGKVSERNLRRIREVLDRVDYHPNLVARSLASAREQTLAVIIPAFREGEYWADVDRGIERAAAEAGRFNVRVRKFSFDQYDRTSFERTLTRVRDEHFDGVVIATLFAEMVVEFTRELDEQQIPYVFVDSDIFGSKRLAYFGTSSFDAGVVAARLLTEGMDRQADLVVASIIHRGTGGSNQCRNREEGFSDYLRRVGFRGTVHRASLRLDDDLYNNRVLDALFDANPRIAGAVTFNSTCYILAGYLQRSGREGVKLVGYDIIGRNRDMLLAGTVTALIAQRPEAQGYHGVMALCEHLVGGRRVPRVNNMPIDILLKENIRYYNNNII
ncbi:LacI family DNA-binding transcriptional regulator [Alistipes sp.]|uniref:LacI family DNA-binding transcriptional regulator n=1 Tax=Alistipes sp. TaxID=1872444 RepID=UPI003AEFB47B